MNKELTNLISNNEKEIVTEKFVIKNNILKFDHLTLNLSNISKLYAGEREFKLPRGVILGFLIAGAIAFLKPLVGLILIALVGFYLFSKYKAHANGKAYLSFNLNSGEYYYIFFQEKEFLTQVRETVEEAFNNNKVNASINIQDQKIVTGDHHVVYGDHANINSGEQKDNVIHALNSDSYNTSTTTVGDISNSSLNAAVIGNKNFQLVKAEQEYDWPIISLGLQTVIDSIEGEDLVKQVSQEALQAAEAKNQQKFESVIKANKKEFMSTLFNNFASGLLVQIVSKIVGIV